MKNRIVWIFLAGLAVGLALGFIAVDMKGKRIQSEIKEETVKEEAEQTDEELGEQEENLEHIEEIPASMEELYDITEVKEEEESETVERIRGKLDELMHNNTYIQLYVGENECNTYVFNKKGESIFSQYDGTVFSVTRSDKFTALYHDGNVVTGRDLSFLEVVDRVVEQVNKDDSTKMFNLELKGNSESSKYKKKTKITIYDKEALHDIYNVEYSDYDDRMVANIEENLGENVEINYYITEFEDGSIVVENSYYSPKENEEYILCYFDGYYILDDWELDNDWYTMVEDEISAEDLEEMANKVFTNIKNLIVKYASDNNLEVETLDYSKYEEEKQNN